MLLASRCLLVVSYTIDYGKMGDQTFDTDLLAGDDGHLWLFAQVCVLKQQMRAHQVQIDHLKEALERTIKSTPETTNLCEKYSRCGGVLLEEHGRLACTDCGDVRYL